MDLTTPITTEEQLEAIITERTNNAVQARLSREAKKYEAYTSPEDLKAMQADFDKRIADLNGALTAAKEKATQYDANIAERDAKIRAYETSSVKMRIAHEVGLPYELHGRLTGETEEEIRADAEGLAKLMKASVAVPMAATETPVSQDTKTQALKNVLNQLRGE